MERLLQPARVIGVIYTQGEERLRLLKGMSEAPAGCRLPAIFADYINELLSFIVMCSSGADSGNVIEGFIN
jgi:hypothetical protein